MRMKTAFAVAMTAVLLPGLAFAAETTLPAPDFSVLTDYILSIIPIGVAAIGIGLAAALAFTVVVRIGKKILGSAG